MLLSQLLPLEFLALAAIILFAQSTVAGGTCSNVAPQPIGIDFADAFVYVCRSSMAAMCN
jgi:hypothetical protein